MGIFEKIFKRKRPREPKYDMVNMVIDENVINTNDAMRIIEPVWWSVSIYDSEEKYEKDLLPFSLPQRHVFAIQWYVSEINNGGHYQFYDNSTGIVWEDALKGFDAIGAQRNSDIIKASAERIGGCPSKIREERWEQLEKHSTDDSDLFGDLDTAYYESEREMMELLNSYIHTNAKDFLFSGDIWMPSIYKMPPLGGGQ